MQTSKWWEKNNDIRLWLARYLQDVRVYIQLEIPYILYTQLIRIPQLYVQGASTKFRFIYPAHDSKNFAIYTEIDEESKQRAYLLPKIDTEQKGQRQYVIRVVDTKNQDPKGKYVFSTSKSTFPGLKTKHHACSLWTIGSSFNETESTTVYIVVFAAMINNYIMHVLIAW